MEFLLQNNYDINAIMLGTRIIFELFNFVPLFCHIMVSSMTLINMKLYVKALKEAYLKTQECLLCKLYVFSH